MQKAGVILLNGNDQILLVLGKKANKWSIPKGDVNEGEDIVEAAHRELTEETGVSITPEETGHGSVTISGIFFCVYSTDRVIDLTENKFDAEEVSRVEWVDQDSIRDLGLLNGSLFNYERYNRHKLKRRMGRVSRVTQADGWVSVPRAKAVAPRLQEEHKTETTMVLNPFETLYTD